MSLKILTKFFFFLGFTRYFNKVEHIDMPPSQFWYCTLSITILWMSSLCSTLFILNMTFDRFYSIIKPHKAASFNTVKKAKITIVCIVIFSILYNVPHFFITAQQERQCIPFGNAIESLFGQIYYWLSLIINFFIPFVLLLVMNSFIIHTIRNRGKNDVRSEGQGQGSNIKSSEMQIYVILLLVTFGFLILMTPSYVLFVYVMFVDYEKNAYSYAGFILFHSVAQKTYYTNYGINFYLYVISGQKFRADLMQLLRCYREKLNDVFHSSTSARISSVA